MHDLIYALAFIVMVATPALVAAFGGGRESKSGPEVRSERRPAPKRARSAIRPRPAPRIALAGHPFVIHDGPTLPVHNLRGMANR